VNLVADAKSPGGFDLAVTNGEDGTVAVLPGRGQGFFDDRTPQLVALPAPPATGPVVVGGEAVLATVDGALVGFDLATLSDVHTVFDAGEVSALGRVSDGELAVARADGKVDLLRWDSSLGLFDLDAELQALSGLPSDPSDLAVLQSDNGLRVLVTQAGSNALFVFALPAGNAPTEPTPASAGEPVPTLLPAGLVVIVTVLPGSPTPSAEPAASPPPSPPTVETSAPVVELSGVDQEEDSADVAAAGVPFPAPINDALEKLRLIGPDDAKPMPEAPPKKEQLPPKKETPRPMPQSLAPSIAPRDLVWSDPAWLEATLADAVADSLVAPRLPRFSDVLTTEHATESLTGTPTRSASEATRNLACASGWYGASAAQQAIGAVLLLMGSAGLLETGRLWERERQTNAI
jgi:hypothetical protein